MAIILPIVVMFVFCALYAGAYVWMRRPKFGESEDALNELNTNKAIDIGTGRNHESNVENRRDSKSR